MGGGYSIPATKHPDIPIFMISFSERQVCVFNAEERALFLCRDILQKDYWGVEEEKTLDDVILFKCKKRITRAESNISDNFIPENDTKKFEGHKFLVAMSTLMKELLEEGYIKLCACNLNWYTEVDVWYLYKSPHTLPGRGELDFCIIDLRSYDKIGLFKLPQDLVEAVNFTVYDHWEPKIDKAEDNVLFSFLRLKGTPWGKTRDRTNVKSVILVMKMIECMGSRGWVLYSSCNLDGKNDTLFFYRNKIQEHPCSFHAHIFALSMNRSDRLRLLSAHKPAIDAVRKVLEINWKGIQSDMTEPEFVEFKLQGKPWFDEKDKCVPVISLLCAILARLRSLGYVAFSNVELIYGTTSKGVFYFAQVQPKDVEFCAISLKSAGLIYGVNINRYITLHTLVIRDIQESLSKAFKPYFEEEPTMVQLSEEQQKAVKWSLKGSPWAAAKNSKSLKFNAQILVAHVIHTLMEYDYHLYSCAHISGCIISNDDGPVYKPEGDTLFFTRGEKPILFQLLSKDPGIRFLDQVSISGV